MNWPKKLSLRNPLLCPIYIIINSVDKTKLSREWGLSSSPDGYIVLCSWIGHVTLPVHLSTWKCDWELVNIQQNQTKCWTVPCEGASIPSGSTTQRVSHTCVKHIHVKIFGLFRHHYNIQNSSTFTQNLR